MAQVRPEPSSQPAGAGPASTRSPADSAGPRPQESAQASSSERAGEAAPTAGESAPAAGETHRRYLYPRWPWLPPVRWIRAAFLEGVIRPLTWLLAKPTVVASPEVFSQLAEPVLIIANHITAYDAPLVQYALPGRLRRRVAVAMSGEMLEDFRHFRNPEPGPGYGRFYPLGPLAWFLATALFNVFPLPRLRDFQRSFLHAGAGLDRGYHVLVFPEGMRSASGQLARFRPGIGLLVKQAGAAVLPVALCGVGELKARGKGWFRSGKLEIRVGLPIRFTPETTEAAITIRLHDEVERLLGA